MLYPWLQHRTIIQLRTSSRSKVCVCVCILFRKIAIPTYSPSTPTGSKSGGGQLKSVRESRDTFYKLSKRGTCPASQPFGWINGWRVKPDHTPHSFIQMIAFIRMNGGFNFWFWFSVAGSEDPAMSKKKGYKHPAKHIQQEDPTEKTHTHKHTAEHANDPSKWSKRTKKWREPWQV